MQFGLDLALYSIIGGAVVILLLVLISFLINSKRITSLEERIELLEKDHFDLSQEANGMTLERETLARKLAHSEAKLNALEGAFRAVRENNDALVDSIHKLEEKLKGEGVKEETRSTLKAQVYDRASGADFKSVSAHEMAVNTPGETPSIVKNTINPTKHLEKTSESKEDLKEKALRAQKEFIEQRARQEQAHISRPNTLQMQDPAFFDSQEVVDRAMHLMDEGASYDKIMHDTLLSAEELDMLYAVRSKNDVKAHPLKSELEHLKPKVNQVPKNLYAAPEHGESFDPEFILEKQREAQAAIERLSKSQEQVVSKVSYNNYQDDEDEEREIRKSLAQAMQQDFNDDHEPQENYESAESLEDTQVSTQSFAGRLSHHDLPTQEPLYAKDEDFQEHIDPTVPFDSQGVSGHELVTPHSKVDAGEEQDLHERLAKAMHEYEEAPLAQDQDSISENTKVVLRSQEPSFAQSKADFIQPSFIKPQEQKVPQVETKPQVSAKEHGTSAEDVALEIAKLKAQGVVFNQKPTATAKVNSNATLRDGPMVSSPTNNVLANHPKIASKAAQGAYGMNAPHSLRSRKR